MKTIQTASLLVGITLLAAGCATPRADYTIFIRTARQVPDGNGPQPPGLIRVTVYRTGWILNGKRTTLEEIDLFLRQKHAAQPNTRVLILVTQDSDSRKVFDGWATCKATGIKDISMHPLWEWEEILSNKMPGQVP